IVSRRLLLQLLSVSQHHAAPRFFDRVVLPPANEAQGMLGAIAGDIIGSPYEADPIKTTEFPLFGPGCRWTDDTVLTVAVADTLLEGGDYAENLKQYCVMYPNAGYGPDFLRWGRSEAREGYNSWGNGSAMRVSP